MEITPDKMGEINHESTMVVKVFPLSGVNPLRTTVKPTTAPIML